VRTWPQAGPARQKSVTAHVCGLALNGWGLLRGCSGPSPTQKSCLLAGNAAVKIWRVFWALRCSSGRRQCSFRMRSDLIGWFGWC